MWLGWASTRRGAGTRPGRELGGTVEDDIGTGGCEHIEAMVLLESTSVKLRRRVIQVTGR